MHRCTCPCRTQNARHSLIIARRVVWLHVVQKLWHFIFLLVLRNLIYGMSYDLLFHFVWFSVEVLTLIFYKNIPLGGRYIVKKDLQKLMSPALVFSSPQKNFRRTCFSKFTCAMFWLRVANMWQWVYHWCYRCRFSRRDDKKFWNSYNFRLLRGYILKK